MIRLRFSTEKWSLLSAAIRWRTDSKISHVEFQRDDGTTLGARYSLLGKVGRVLRVKKWENLDGVQWRPEEANSRQSNVIMATFPGIEEAYDWAVRNMLGQPYDLMGILGIASAGGQHDWNDKFCSEMIALAAEATGHKLLDSDPSAVSPRDLLIAPSVVVDMQGGTR